MAEEYNMVVIGAGAAGLTASAFVGELGGKVAQAMQTPGDHRDRHTEYTYITRDTNEALGQVENTLHLIKDASPAYSKIYKALKKRELPKLPMFKLIEPALEKGIISEEEAKQIQAAEDGRYEAIKVDEFTLEEYQHGTPTTPLDMKPVKPEPEPVEAEE